MRRVRTHNRPSGSPMNANAISRFLTVLKSSSVDEIVRTAGPMRRCAKATISSLVRSPSNWYTLSPLRLKKTSRMSSFVASHKRSKCHASNFSISYLQEDCGIARDSKLSANVGEARAVNSTDAEVPLARE